MSWGSDELRHRSAERSGWVGELRAADPADVDDSVPGAVEFAAATGEHGSAGADDAETPRTCGFCRGSVPEREALDGDGHPVGGFEWVGGADAEVYHRECVSAGDGRFLPWAANGVLGDETDRE